MGEELGCWSMHACTLTLPSRASSATLAAEAEQREAVGGGDVPRRHRGEVGQWRRRVRLAAVAGLASIESSVRAVGGGGGRIGRGAAHPVATFQKGPRARADALARLHLHDGREVVRWRVCRGRGRATPRERIAGVCQIEDGAEEVLCLKVTSRGACDPRLHLLGLLDARAEHVRGDERRHAVRSKGALAGAVHRLRQLRRVEVDADTRRTVEEERGSVGDQWEVGGRSAGGRWEVTEGRGRFELTC